LRVAPLSFYDCIVAEKIANCEHRLRLRTSAAVATMAGFTINGGGQSPFGSLLIIIPLVQKRSIFIKLTVQQALFKFMH
jgi:hypothetical protein